MATMIYMNTYRGDDISNNNCTNSFEDVIITFESLFVLINLIGGSGVKYPLHWIYAKGLCLPGCEVYSDDKTSS